MIVFGVCGWIVKYFQFVESGFFLFIWLILFKINVDCYVYNLLVCFGVVFGFLEEFIFVWEFDKCKWIIDEQLKVCLFEVLVFVWLKYYWNVLFDSVWFLNVFDNFYKKYCYILFFGVLGFLLCEFILEWIEWVLSK